MSLRKNVREHRISVALAQGAFAVRGGPGTVVSPPARAQFRSADVGDELSVAGGIN